MVSVLIVDDSSLIRRVLSRELSTDPEIQVLGAAPDPYVAREMIVAHKPDVLLIGEDFRYPNEGNAVTHGYDAQWGGNHTDGWAGGGNNFNQVMQIYLASGDAQATATAMQAVCVQAGACGQ